MRPAARPRWCRIQSARLDVVKRGAAMSAALRVSVSPQGFQPTQPRVESRALAPYSLQPNIHRKQRAMKSLSITSDQFPDAFAGRCPGIVVDVFWRVASGPNRPEGRLPARRGTRSGMRLHPRITVLRTRAPERMGTRIHHRVVRCGHGSLEPGRQETWCPCLGIRRSPPTRLPRRNCAAGPSISLARRSMVTLPPLRALRRARPSRTGIA